MTQRHVDTEGASFGPDPFRIDPAPRLATATPRTRSRPAWRLRDGWLLARGPTAGRGASTSCTGALT
jgi:hypothetical protein